jgi:hypothetical protein|eukprot:COSAG01_NODE_4349_length_5115_cov_2.076555_8_plen_136_part_00
MPSLSRPGVACFETEWRRPHNDLQEQHVGGGHKAIHDDATAASVGFSGAPIHGTVHWSQFTPLLLRVFGKEWMERGSISVAFKNIVTHLQPVKAFIQSDSGAAAGGGGVAEIWMEHLDGIFYSTGTRTCARRLPH